MKFILGWGLRVQGLGFGLVLDSFGSWGWGWGVGVEDIMLPCIGDEHLSV